MNKSVVECLTEHRTILDDHTNQFIDIQKKISKLQNGTHKKKYTHIFKRDSTGNRGNTGTRAEQPSSSSSDMQESHKYKRKLQRALVILAFCFTLMVFLNSPSGHWK